MRETDKLLARIKNLIGEDSTILKGFEDKIDKVSKDKVKWEETRKKIEKDITDIQSDIDSITKASELSDRFDQAVFNSSRTRTICYVSLCLTSQCYIPGAQAVLNEYFVY